MKKCNMTDKFFKRNKCQYHYSLNLSCDSTVSYITADNMMAVSEGFI